VTREPYYRWIQYVKTFYSSKAQTSILVSTNTPPITTVKALQLSHKYNLTDYQPVKIYTMEDACLLEDAGLLELAQQIDADKYQQVLSILDNFQLRGMLEVLLSRLSVEETNALVTSADYHLSESTIKIFRDLFWDIKYADFNVRKALIEMHSHSDPTLLTDALKGVPIDSLLWSMGFGFSNAGNDKKLDLLFDASLAAGLKDAFLGHTGNLAKLGAVSIQLSRELQEKSSVERLQQRLEGAKIITEAPEIKKLPEA
jgi:hypothetical protein